MIPEKEVRTPSSPPCRRISRTGLCRKAGKFINDVGWLFFALLLVAAEALFMTLIAGPLALWEKVRCTAQSLRCPPPPGGMYGAMARTLKARAGQRCGK